MATSAAPARVVEKVEVYSWKGVARDFTIVLSLVNVAYLRVWSELLTIQPKDMFWRAHGYSSASYLAPVIGVLIAAVILTSVAVLVRRYFSGWKLRAACVGFLLLTLIPALQVRDVLVAYFPEQFNFLRAPVLGLISTWGGRLAILLVGCGLLYAAIRWYRTFVRIIAGIFLIAAPFTVMTFGHALFSAITARPDWPKSRTASFLPVAPGTPRVVWVILDEWDYRLTFLDRPKDLAMPAVDRLGKEVLFADHAVSPEWATQLSMPSFVDGRRVAAANPLGKDVYGMRYENSSSTIVWGSAPNVFSRARASGFNTAVVGWYMPYCKVLAPVLSSCWTFPMEMQSNTTGPTLVNKVVDEARSIFETRTVSPFGQSLVTQRRITNYRNIMEQARAAVLDKRLGLVLLHLPVPHSPHTYDRRTGTFTLANRPISGYIDSLALLDRTIADLRKTLEDAGMWDQTTIVFSADHPFRSALYYDGKMDVRIPFLVKFAGQKEGAVYHKKFNTVVTGGLLLGVLKRQVKDAAGAEAWLDAHLITDTATPTVLEAQ